MAILLGFVFFSVELRLLTRSAYERRGWGREWGLFTGTYGEGRFFVAGPLMIEFLAYNKVARPYVRVF